MELDSDKILPVAALGALLAVFFVGGFLVNDFLGVGQQTQIGNQTQQAEEEGKTLSQQQALEKVKNYLVSGPLSYPFTYNLTTVSVSKDKRLEGTDYLYNWTISYTVEANPFDSGIYYVPPNQTKTTQTMTLYVTKNGNYFFASVPYETEIQRRAPSGAVKTIS